MPKKLNDNRTLVQHITRTLYEQTDAKKIFLNYNVDPQTSAGVLLLLGLERDKKKNFAEPCLILNKRSLKVRQPGDLCFPGGSIAPRLDSFLAKLFTLPGTSLRRWQYWPKVKRGHPRAARLLALLWATGLRESLEEMRLNPLGVRFLGPMPPRSLVMFQRTIYPIVAWIKSQKRFLPNWEVEKIIYLPLRELMDPAYYRRYRLRMKLSADAEPSNLIREYPCFQFPHNHQIEILWGATYQIAIVFLEFIFGFKPPDLDTLPVVEGSLDHAYMTGSR
jgi:8-oxo-dGTP pyrophosphatase MutT (NUDIX family)